MNVLIFRTPPRVLGLTLTLLADGQLTVAGCLVRRAGDTMVLEQHLPEISGLPELAATGIGREVPVALVLQGRGVLLKSVPGTVSPDQSAPLDLRTVLPGAAAADFWVQRDFGEAGEFLAIVRREEVRRLLAALAQQQRFVLAVEAGPCVLQPLIPFLGDAWQNGTQRAGQYALTLHAGKLTGVDTLPLTPEPAPACRIGDDEVTTDTLLAYAGAVSVLLNNTNRGLVPAEVTAQRGEWQQRQLFVWGGLTVLAVFLMGLLANFILFTEFTAENQALTSQTLTHEKELRTLAALQQTERAQQQFLQSAGWLVSTSQSVYADQLAATVPAGITLQLLDLNPVDEARSRQQQETVFQPGSILVRGQCTEAQVLSGWLQVLSRAHWIDKIQQQNFTYDYAAGTGSFSFRLQVASGATLTP